MNNIDFVVDTNILIDIFRASPPAISWATQSRDARLGIPIPVWFEIVVGARDATEQNRICKNLEAYEIIYLDNQAQELARDLFKTYRLSNGVGAPDCLIAAAAIGAGKPFCTLNEKHFSIIPGLQVIRPY